MFFAGVFPLGNRTYRAWVLKIYVKMENETKSTDQQHQNVTRAAGVVSLAVMVSRILGLAPRNGDKLLLPGGG